MKKNSWYRALSLADDKYIAEANPDNVVRRKRSRRFVSIAAACACLALVVCNLWLFIPYSTTPPSVSQYRDSEYYDIIEKLNVLTYQPPKYKNNAEALWAGIKNWNRIFLATKEDNVAESIAPTDGMSDYQEITDNQVEGIIEADRIKRSDTHIYYLDNNVLRIFSIDKESTTEVGNYVLNKVGADYQCEFYLSDDCKTVTVIADYYVLNDHIPHSYVNLISLDVSDPANVVKKDEFSITGSYKSSRKVDGDILLLTSFGVIKKELDFDDETTFLPQIKEGSGWRYISSSDIVVPDTLSTTRYTVVTKLDENTLDLKGTAAYLSYSQEVYVSEDHVFLTNAFSEKNKNKGGTTTTNSMTEISCLTYSGDNFEIKGNVTVRGSVKDQWSMDEYEGVLRVFTTTNTTVTKRKTQSTQRNASLYCVDLSSFEIIASVVDFAPPNEEIKSARFDKETAYACTAPAARLIDPVFFFDLSDLDNITYKDTGTIEGFSTSLINFGNGYLLGIGRGNSWSNLKVEVYEEAENGVHSVCSYELENVIYSTEYKSYYVDRQNQLIGLGVDGRFGEKYVLLRFDGYKLVKLVDEFLIGRPDYMRGVYIDGYMYMFGECDFKVKKVS